MSDASVVHWDATMDMESPSATLEPLMVIMLLSNAVLGMLVKLAPDPEKVPVVMTSPVSVKAPSMVTASLNSTVLLNTAHGVGGCINVKVFIIVLCAVQ